MKESKQKCAKPPPAPRPNMKNKDFVKWQKAESCKKDDNIVSTEWHERLQKTPLFTPVYDDIPLNMVYLLSGEYGRLWQKERDEWYSKVFVLSGKDLDMENRKKKIRKEIREAKKAAEVSIQERKVRKAKEAEIKAKIEAEKAEKLKAKIAKCAEKKKIEKKKKEDTKQQKVEAAPADTKQETCPKGWTTVELTMQCECTNHKKEGAEAETKEEAAVETVKEQTEESKQPTMCKDYIQQLKEIQDTKNKLSPKSSKHEIYSSKENENKNDVATEKENAIAV